MMTALRPALGSRGNVCLSAGRRSQLRRAHLSASCSSTDQIRHTSSASFVSLQDGVFTVQGTLTTTASPEVVFAALAPEFSSSVFGSVKSSQVERGAQAGQAQVKQVCRWNFMALSGTFDALLDIEERPQDLMISFQLRESSFMRKMDGHWRVEPSPAGSSSSSDSSSGGCTVRHVLSVQPALDMPAPVAHCVKSIFVDQEKQILEDLGMAVGRLQQQQQLAEQAAAVADKDAQLGTAVV